MFRTLFPAALAVVLGFVAAPAVNAQQILSSKRTISADAQSYEPFYDNITYYDSDSDSTTAAGLWEVEVDAFVATFPNDWGEAYASQNSILDVNAKSFDAAGSGYANWSYQYGSYSGGLGKSEFEVTFRLTRSGGIYLSGSMLTEGWSFLDPSEVYNTYSTVKIVNVNTGSVVYQKTAGFTETVWIDETVPLPKGKYKVVITAVAATGEIYFIDEYVSDASATFGIQGQIFHNP